MATTIIPKQVLSNPPKSVDTVSRSNTFTQTSPGGYSRTVTHYTDTNKYVASPWTFSGRGGGGKTGIEAFDKAGIYVSPNIINQINTPPPGVPPQTTRSTPTPSAATGQTEASVRAATQDILARQQQNYNFDVIKRKEENYNRNVANELKQRIARVESGQAKESRSKFITENITMQSLPSIKSKYFSPTQQPQIDTSEPTTETKTVTMTFQENDLGTTFRGAKDTQLLVTENGVQRLPTIQEVINFNAHGEVPRDQPSELTLKDVFGKSFFYEIVPYTSQEIVKGLRMIPGLKEPIDNLNRKSIKELNIEPSIQFLNKDISFNLPAGDFIGGLPSAAPLEIFGIVGKVNKPMVTKEFKPRVETTFIEKQFTAESPNGKFQRFAKYDIQSKSFPAEIEVNTLQRQFLGIKGARGTIGEISLARTKAPFYSQLGEPFGVIEKTPRTTTINKISGTIGEPITDLPKAYSRANKVEQRLIQELKPLSSEKFNTNLIDKESQYSFYEVNRQRYLTGKKKALMKDLSLTGFGKRESRAIGLSKTDLVPTQEGSLVEIYKSEIAFKDTTLPQQFNARGGIRKMTGTTLILKEPIKLEALFKFKEPQGLNLKANLPKEPLKVSRPYNLQEIKSLLEFKMAPKVIPKVKVRSVPGLTTTKSFEISGLGKINLPSLKTNEIISTKEISKAVYKENLLPRTKSITQLKPGLKYHTKANTKLMQDLKPELKLKEMQKLSQKVMQKVMQKEMLRFSNRLMPREPRLTFPKSSKPIALIPKQQFPKPKKKYLSSFDILEISKGKPYVRARGLTKQSALDLGTRDILSGLKATFILKPSKLAARDLGLGNEFGKYKGLFREPKGKSRYKGLGEAYIQRQAKVGIYGGRLAFPGEKRQIRKARMNKLMNLVK